MKLLLLLCINIVLSASLLTAQAPRHHSLSLDCTPVASGGATKTDSAVKSTQRTYSDSNNRYQENAHSTTRMSQSGTDLQIAVRNLGQTPETAQVEWFFLAKAVGAANPHIHDRGEQELQIGPGREEKLLAECKEITLTVSKKLTTYGASGAQPTSSQKEKGDKQAGWIVRVLADGELVAMKASSPTLEAVGRDEEKLRALLKGSRNNRAPKKKK